MESDERFAHLAKDPRFRTLRRKQRKVQIDERFKSMFTDEKFTLKYTKDKRGWRQNKTSGDDLKKFYSLEDDKTEELNAKESSKKSLETEQEDDKSVNREESESAEDDDELASVSSADGGDDQKEGSTSASELSSSSDESESDAESILDDEIEGDRIVYDWQPLDHDAETAEATSKRLAIQNLDWDHLDVRDIYILVNSIRPPSSVRIYVSEFGKERLKQEKLQGPKELTETSKDEEEEKEYRLLKEKMEALNAPKVHKINEYEDADEEIDPKNEELREKIRRYQLSRMKYYYAVVEFDSAESAELVYKELDGMEYEGSSLELDLRFIPDDIEFDPEDVESECDQLPDPTSYKAPLFINSALQQTTVKFTWDQTDIKRQEKLNRAYTKEELEKDDLDAYLASETDSEEDETGDVMNFDDTVSVVTGNSEARINKYKMLLKSIDEEEEKKKKVDVDVEWGNFSEEERNVEGDIEEEMEENYDSDGEEEVPEFRNKKDKKKHESMKKTKSQKKVKKQKNKRKDREVDDEDGEKGDELDLLVMDPNAVQREEFEFNPDDPRFKAVYESGAYNIDPSHPNFKPTKAFDMIAERKREKRHKTRS